MRELDPAGAGETFPGAGDLYDGAVRILLVCPAPPERPSHGAAPLVVPQLVAHLSERHALGIVALAGRGDGGRDWLVARTARIEIVPAQPRTRSLSGRPADDLASLAAAVRRASAEFQPDVVHLDGTRFARLARATSVPAVLRFDERPPARELDAGRSPVWQTLRARLDGRPEPGSARDWLRGVTCVVECEEDRRAVSAHLPLEGTEVIPAGIDAERYAYRRIGDRSRMLFTGDVGIPDHLEAARRLATSILPLVRRRTPRAELLIAVTGSAEPAHELGRLDGVRVDGRLSDLRPSVWGAGVYVSPLLSGGRGPRLLEPLALGTPVVASPASVARLDEIVPGQHLLVAERDADVADAVCLLMREPVVGRTLARNARALIERCRNWSAIAQRYDDVYQRLAQRPLPRAA